MAMILHWKYEHGNTVLRQTAAEVAESLDLGAALADMVSDRLSIPVPYGARLLVVEPSK